MPLLSRMIHQSCYPAPTLAHFGQLGGSGTPLPKATPAKPGPRWLLVDFVRFVSLSLGKQWMPGPVCRRGLILAPPLWGWTRAADKNSSTGVDRFCLEACYQISGPRPRPQCPLLASRLKRIGHT